MSDEEVSQNVADEVGGVVENPLDESDVTEAAKKGVEHLRRFAEVMRENGFGATLDQAAFDVVFGKFRELAGSDVSPTT